MKNQRFGIEIEMTGLTRKRASEIIALHFSSRSVYEKSQKYNKHYVFKRRSYLQGIKGKCC